MGVRLSNIALNANSHMFIYGIEQQQQIGGSTGGAAYFNGANANLTVPGSSDWAIGSSDFTIEWWQYMMTGGGTAPRIFSIGGFPSASIAVSQEGQNTFYLWAGGGALMNFSISNINTWVHYAVVRQSGTTTVYQNGTSAVSTSTSFALTDSSSVLSIGAEYQTASAGVTFFNGYLTNFRWTDSAVYVGDFSPPTTPLTVLPNTKLLMKETDSASLLTDSAQGLTVTNIGDNVTWANVHP